MYFALEPYQQAAFPHLMDQMFRLRQKVFCQELSWVETNGPQERDVYDDLGAVYIMHTDPSGTQLYASARLMPTSGPTLLSDVFGSTLPDATNFDSPLVWEVTRLCVDDELLRQHGRGAERMRIVRGMGVAFQEFGVQAGVETYLANCDNIRLRMWRRCGARFDVIGTSDLFGAPVHLGLFECSESEHARLLAEMGESAPLLSAPPTALPTYMPELRVAA